MVCIEIMHRAPNLFRQILIVLRSAARGVHGGVDDIVVRHAVSRAAAKRDPIVRDDGSGPARNHDFRAFFADQIRPIGVNATALSARAAEAKGFRQATKQAADRAIVAGNAE